MDLFEILPYDFFHVLTGKNKEIYAKCLLLLTRSLEHDELKIKKEDFVRNLKDAEINWTENFEYENGDIPNNAPVITSKISYTVNRLEECGWIEMIIDPDNLDEYVALPDYTIQFLNAIKSILSDGDALYDSLVHSTYSELKLEDEEPDQFLYTSLLKAYQNTKKLRSDIVTLGHSIQISSNRLGNLFSTNEILVDHFDRFKERVANRYYHPLKTFDSVTRFKRPIIAILNRWLNDREIRQQLVAQSLIFQKEKDYRNAEQDVINKIIEICDLYEQFEKMIEGIDEQYSSYTKSSVTKIIYLNNSDKTIKGHLETIFKYYAKIAKKNDTSNLSKLLSGMQDGAHFYDQGFIDGDSVTLPLLRIGRDDQEPIPLLDFDDFDDELMNSFVRAAGETLTDVKIYDFMESVFNGRNLITANDIPFDKYINFVMYIIAVARSIDDNCFYKITNLDNHDYIQLFGYYVPNFTFSRKIQEGE